MECNKDEAIRAKDMAESKMLNKQFDKARVLALKAQRLYTDLENISQMLCVCDVHCLAEKKVSGNEVDWYGILQVEQTADEATIKKQYRKFALQLHPDKNKFPGAEAAFKLVGEAQRVLLDKEKRSLYDIKCRVTVSKPAPHLWRPNSGTNSGFQSSHIRSNFTDVNLQFQQQPYAAPQQGSYNGRPTFWTACPFCNVKYQYYIETKNKSLSCQTCKKTFTAYERSMHMSSTRPNPKVVAPFPQKKDALPNHTSKVELKYQGNFRAGSSGNEFCPKKGPTSEFRAEKANGKRRRKSEESDESCDTENSTDSEDMAVDEDCDFKAGLNSVGKGQVTRRSVRHKQQVSYKENLSDDDFVSHPKVSKGSQSSFTHYEGTENGFKEETAKTDEQVSDAADHNEVKEEQSPGGLPNDKKETETKKESVEPNSCHKSSETCVESPAEPDGDDYPDPDFNDFDKIRKKECFSVGQFWALYDTLNAMPRFYAKIRKVCPSGFKLRVTWFEADPDDRNEIEWVKAGLPASCGKFKSGDDETTSDRLSFSHQIYPVDISQRSTIKILPRKGSTWALFKNWDINWKSRVPEGKHEYEYEFVEVLTDYVEGVGVNVAFLGKVKGFVSVFHRVSREGKNSHPISPGELFRFSHMVPSYKLTGEEREGVPKDSFELDPLSLPKNIEETTFEGSGLNDEALEIPEPEFFDFDGAKSPETLKAGQVWALYSDEDGLPKYYGLIQTIDREKFEVHINWLTVLRPSRHIVLWKDKAMLVSCGYFKVQSSRESYTDMGAFSHRVSVKKNSKGVYCITPKKGEVWALYRNWSTEIKLADLENCEYDIVEVVEDARLHTRVAFLEKVRDFKAVFKPLMKDGAAVTMDVVPLEFTRFSHKMPAFQLTDEKGGLLRGYWEVDPAALPVHYLSLNK